MFSKLSFVIILLLNIAKATKLESMAKRYICLRNGYHYEEKVKLAEPLYFGSYQRDLQAVILVKSNGPVLVKWNDKQEEMNSQFMFLVLSKEEGTIIPLPGSTIDYRALYFSVYPFFTDYSKIDLEGMKIHQPNYYAHERVLHIEEDINFALLRVLEAAFFLFSLNNPVFYLSEQRLIYEFFSLYEKKMIHIGFRIPSYATAEPLEPAFELIGSNPGSMPKLEQLAKACSMSKTSFIRKFKQTYGEPPSSYFETLRLENSKYFLLNTNDPVQEISYRLGYSSPSAYIRSFTGKFALSPTQFRRKKSIK